MNRGIRPLACALEGERHLLSPLCQPSFRFTRFFPAGSDWRASHPVVAWDPGLADDGGTVADPCD